MFHVYTSFALNSVVVFTVSSNISHLCALAEINDDRSVVVDGQMQTGAFTRGVLRSGALLVVVVFIVGMCVCCLDARAFRWWVDSGWFGWIFIMWRWRGVVYSSVMITNVCMSHRIPADLHEDFVVRQTRLCITISTCARSQLMWARFSSQYAFVLFVSCQEHD